MPPLIGHCRGAFADLKSMVQPAGASPGEGPSRVRSTVWRRRHEWRRQRREASKELTRPHLRARRVALVMMQTAPSGPAAARTVNLELVRSAASPTVFSNSTWCAERKGPAGRALNCAVDDQLPPPLPHAAASRWEERILLNKILLNNLNRISAGLCFGPNPTSTVHPWHSFKAPGRPTAHARTQCRRFAAGRRSPAVRLLAYSRVARITRMPCPLPAFTPLQAGSSRGTQQ